MSVPAISFLTVPLSLIFFTVCQTQFVKAHNISQWISRNSQNWTTKQIINAVFFNIFPSKELKENFKKFEEQNIIKFASKQRYLPTIILSIPYLYSLFLTPKFLIVIVATVIGLFLHKSFNSILKNKLSIFRNIDNETNIPTISQFLSNKTIIDLSNETDKQLLIDILNEQTLSSQEAKDFADKINLTDLQQSKFLLEVFEKQIKITDYNKKLIIEALVQKFDNQDSNQINFIRNLLLNDKFFAIDENIAVILVEKLNFYNKEQLALLKDFLSTKIYNRNLLKDNLNTKLINKIDINNVLQMELLGLFYQISDKDLHFLLSKFDFSNKEALKNLFNIISQYYLLQKNKTFELILNNLDLKNNIDFKLLQDVVFNTNYIDGYSADKIFAKLNFSDKKHLNLIENIIRRRNVDIKVIDSFTKYMDINNPVHISLVKKLIETFFRTNTVDSGLIFYQKIYVVFRNKRTANIKLFFLK